MLTVTVEPTTNDLTEISTVQTELRLTDQGDIEAIPDLIRKASAACAAWCGRTEGFGRATVVQTERLTFARECIILERDLAPTITSVVEGGDTLAGTDYEVDGALLYRLEDDERTEWPAEKIVITYDAGFLDGAELADLPHEIERACLDVAAHMHNMRGNDPAVRREDNGLSSWSFADLDRGIPKSAADLLAPYRKFSI